MSVDFSRDSMRTVQQILAADRGNPPPKPYLEHSPRSFGTEPIGLDRFTSREYLRLEYERVWSRVWQWACNKEDIPKVGDHLVYDIGERSVLLVRVAADEIKAYHNACLHRGRQLKTEPGSSMRLQCGFHGWTWNLDGSLARIPCRWDFPQVRDEEFALPEVRCESWSEFVFVTFDDDAPPLLEALDVIPEHFAHFPYEDKYTAAHVQKVMPANWKVTMEAFLESYHEIATHPQIMEWTGDANTQYDVWERSSRLMTLVGVASPHLGPLDEDAVYAAALGYYDTGDAPPELPAGETARSCLAGLTRRSLTGQLGVDPARAAAASDTEVIDFAQYWVFPNWCPWAGLPLVPQYRFRPNGDDPHSSIFEIRLMLPIPAGGPRPAKAPLHILEPDEPWSNAPELLLFSELMTQDEANLRAIQRGLRATVRTAIPYGEHQESRIRLFHKLMDEYMAG